MIHKIITYNATTIKSPRINIYYTTGDSNGNELLTVIEHITYDNFYNFRYICYSDIVSGANKCIVFYQ